MHTRWLILLLMISITAVAQHKDTLPHTAMQDSIAAQVAKLRQINADMDSLQAHQLERLKAEAMARDSANMARNMDAWVRQQKENDEKMKRQLWIKGSLFAVMLAVTIVGFVRRRKAKVQG